MSKIICAHNLACLALYKKIFYQIIYFRLYGKLFHEQEGKILYTKAFLFYYLVRFYSRIYNTPSIAITPKPPINIL